jgi:hypothetical protein
VVFDRILELSNLKARGFQILITLKRLFLKHTRMVFGEMTVRIRIEFCFFLSVSHVFLPSSIRVFAVIPNPVLRTSSSSKVMLS